MDEKKAFKVILPIAFGGMKDPGEIVCLTQAEADNIGPTRLSPMNDETEVKQPEAVDQGGQASQDASASGATSSGSVEETKVDAAASTDAAAVDTSNGAEAAGN